MPNTLRKFQYILEGIDQEHLTDILVKRLKSRYPDISTKYEEDVLYDAAMDVASFHAGAEELGTSDIGNMIREVIKNLERFNKRGQGEKIIPNSVRGWRMNEETEPERLVKHVQAAKKYLGKNPEPKKEPEEKETNESYWGGPSPAQLRFNRALKKQQNSPENKADREKFQKELDRIMPPPKKEPEDKEVTEGSAIPTRGEGSSESKVAAMEKKLQDMQDRLELTRERRKMRGQRIQSTTEIKLAAKMSELRQQIHQLKSNVTESASISTHGTTSGGYTWRFEAGREVPFKTDVDANTFIRVTDPAGKTVAGVWADIAGDSLEVEYSQVFDKELRGRGLYTDLLKSLSKQYDVISDTDTNNAAVSIYKRLGADYDTRQARHTLSKKGVEEGRKKKKKKTSRSLGRYFFPGYSYYGSGESGESGGDGGGGESMAEGTNVDIGGIQLNVVADGAEVIIRPSVDGYQAGYAVFDRDGSTLVPADLAIDEEFRGQGIAKTIYDYVKSLGFTIRRSNDQTRAGKHFWNKNRGEDSQVWEQTMKSEELDEACWDTHKQVGMKNKGGKQVPNCVPKESIEENHQECPECGGPMFSEEMINEKKDACYYKVKSRYKVWPSAYASGALVKCRKKGASNWGNSSKNESSILEGIEQTDENLHKWFKEKWVRFGPDGKIRGDCARGDDSEGKPKCLPQSKAQNLGKKGRASAAARKRREDPNPERSGKAINVATKKKTSESSILQGIDETKGLPMPGSYEQENKPFLRKGGQKIMSLTTEQELEEKWSNKYKKSIDCSHPKGFSQRAHCQGRKKK
jgi:GNAT superfamily N-acetyltransferase